MNAIAKHLGGCARILCLGLALAVFGWAPKSAGQTVITDYEDLSTAIARGGLINQFVTNYLLISLQTPSETFVVSNDVIIDATTNEIILDGAELARLFEVRSNASLTLANLQIIGGLSSLGGAIYNQGKLILNNCFFYGNSATNMTGLDGVDGATNGTENGTSATSGASASGGAIYSTGTLMVSFSTFSNNVVSAGNGGTGGSGAPSDFLFGGDGGDGGSGGSASGGAIAAIGTNTFFATQFIFNECVAGSGGSGGAGGADTIAGDSGSGGVGGSATGGALWVSGRLYMTNCLFDTNSALAGSTAAAKVLGDGTSDNASAGGSAVGGGMDIAAATTAAYIENAIFFNNFCQGGAGGDTLDNPPEATPGNGGSAVGGGLCTAAVLTQMRTCTLATNGLIGGTNGVSTAGGPDGSSGAMTGFDIVRSAGTLTVSGTIFSGGTNAAPDYTPNIAGGLTDAGYNLSSDASAVFTATGSRTRLDPELDAALSSNHGGSNLGPASLSIPTLTLAILTTPAVPTNSPAIGALIGTAGVTFPAFDQTFFPRGNVADIGAFEATPPLASAAQATATATTNNGAVIEAVVTSGGDDYFAAPEVAIVGGGGSNAMATATISNGVVVAVNLIDTGSGYTSSPSIIIAPPGGSAATAIATLTNKSVSAAAITFSGLGYTNTPAVYFVGGGGSNAMADATVSNGMVVALKITKAGSGYSNAPVVIIDSPAGPEAIATASVTAGFVTGASVAFAGSDYQSPPAVYLLGGGGSGATATATIDSDGSLAGITITDAGSGYTNAPTVVIAPPSVPVPSIDIAPATDLAFTGLVPGTGYQLQSSQDSVTWSNVGGVFEATSSTNSQFVDLGFPQMAYQLVPWPGPVGATATATVQNGFVVGVTVTDGGSGYTTVPNVTISGGYGSGAQAAATVANGMVVSIAITDAGSGYASPITVQIDPPPVIPVIPSTAPAIRLDLANLTEHVLYQIQSAASLNNWADFGPGFFAAGSTRSEYLSVGEGNMFFQILSTTNAAAISAGN